MPSVVAIAIATRQPDQLDLGQAERRAEERLGDEVLRAAAP